MELSIDEQTLVAGYRTLDEAGKNELLRYALKQHKSSSSLPLSRHGQCELARCEERPEAVAEPIFTE